VPELPEVETIRRGLDPLLSSRRILEGWGHPSAKFSSAPHATGATIERVGRRGKYLIGSLDDDRELIVHLGMTGSLRVLDSSAWAPGADPYERAHWLLDDGRALVYRDVRRFGRIAVVAAGEYRSLPTLHALGPEPNSAEFTPERLWRSVRSSSRRLKTIVLDQRAVAGVGNIYADEALWTAGLHPARRRLSRPDAEALHAAIVTVIDAGIRNGGTTLRDYVDADGAAGHNQFHLSCYGRGGEPCLRCGSPLQRSVIDARTSTWCRACQRR